MSTIKKQVTIFGASGQVGQRILNLVLDKGFLVNVLTRDKSKFDPHPNQIIIEGSFDQTTISKAVQGSSVVYNCVGIGGLGDGKPNNTVSNATQIMISAMKQHSVSRIICMSNIGIGNSKKHTHGSISS